MTQPAAAVEQNAPVIPPQPQKHPSGDAPFIKSKAQEVADGIDAKNFGPADGDVQEPNKPAVGKPEGDASNKPAGEQAPQVEAPPEQTDVEKLIAERKGKAPADNVEKRKEKIQADIDHLTAQKKALAEEVAQLAVAKSTPAKDPAKGKDELPEYSDEELKAARRKALDEGDADLLDEIDRYKEERLERRLTKKYTEAEQLKTKAVEERESEWKQIVGKFSPAAYQNEQVKVDPDFNVADPKSLLFRLAKGLYEDSELPYAGTKGGMMQATQDAFNQLVLDRASSGFKKAAPGNPKNDSSLQNRLEKEKRKNALGVGAESANEAAASGQQGQNYDELGSYIQQRRELKNKGMRGTGLL